MAGSQNASEQMARIGSEAPLEFHFYCNSVPFSRETIGLKTSLGGSESALIFLARGLVALGHRICIYTQMAAGPDGRPWAEHAQQTVPGGSIQWLEHAALEGHIRARQPDVFVSLRMPDAMQWVPLRDCKLRLLWNEDLLSQPAAYYSVSWQTDLHVFVSDYHREQYIRTIPALRDMTWVTRNPVDIGMISGAIEGVEKVPNRLIHVSRPERALVHGDGSPLLECFKRIRERIPDAALAVCRYHSMYEGSPNVDAICARADQLVAQAEGVEWLGELDKTSLYREIAKSQLMLYPGVANFAETGCIAATEAQACGTPLVATRIGALPETLHPDAGRLLAGDATTEEYQIAFADAAAGLMSDGAEYARCQAAGHEWALRYDHRVVAQEWVDRIQAAYGERFERRKLGVLRQLVWNDDFRAAHALAAQMGPEGEAEIDRMQWGAGAESPEQYAKNAMNPDAEIASMQVRAGAIGGVLNLLYDEAARQQPLRILDFAAGNGCYAAILADWFPNAQIDLLAYSPELCEVAREFLERRGFGDRCTVTCGRLEVAQTDYDLVFAGEIVEHFADPSDIMTRLEACARRPTTDLDSPDAEPFTPGGWVLITTPQGPFCSFMHSTRLDWSEHVRGHKVAFEARDWEEMLRGKPGYDHLHLPVDETPRGELCGHWLVWWQADGLPIRNRDEWRRISRMRPHEQLAVCMIVRNAEDDITRCLKSVERIADEIWIADTGSDDFTMRLAKPFVRNGGEVWSIGTCPDAPGWAPPPGDFGWARNQSISRTTADWIMWIDADEVLTGQDNLHHYLTDSSFNGLSIAQCHLTLDDLNDRQIEQRLPYRYDLPVRVFRRVPVGQQAGMTYQCYAAIHEHFQAGINDLIDPCFRLGNVKLAHTGYMTERLRRWKCQSRNIPLLKWDLERYPNRLLAKLLVAREYVNEARWEQEQILRDTGRRDLPVVRTRPNLRTGLGLIRESNMFDPASLYWEAVYEVYRDVCTLLGIGHDYGVFIVEDTGRMKGVSMRFANDDDYERMVQHQLRRVREISRPPVVAWDGATKAIMPIVGAPKADIMTAAGETTVGGTTAPEG